jgi:hypothetical protein
MRIQNHRRWLAALAATAVLVGCAKRQLVKEPLKEPVQGWGIAVYPVVFRIPVTPYQAYDRGRRLAEMVSARTGWLVYGPGEFRVDDNDSDDLVRGTNLMGAIKYAKDRVPDGLYALRVVVAERRSSGEAQGFAPDGKSRKRRIEERVEVAVRAELLSMRTRSLVLEAEDVASVDPFSEEMERDPFPDVTRLTRDLVEAILVAAEMARIGPPPAVGLDTVAALRPAMTYAPTGTISLQEEWSKLDPLELDAKMIGLVQSVDPEAPRARARLLKNATHGLIVTRAEGPAQAAGLEPNDLILSANGENLTGLHALERQLALGRATLKVKRAGQEQELVLVTTAGR